MYIISIIIVVIGTFFSITTVIGFVRYKTFFKRIHISGINDLLALPMIMFGVSLLFIVQRNYFIMSKFILSIIAILLSTSISNHVLSKIAYHTDNGKKKYNKSKNK